MSFSERLKTAREAVHMSQQDLAESLDITPGTVSNYEKNVAYPRWDKILKLCDILGVDPNYLFWDDLPKHMQDKILKSSSNEAIKMYEQLDRDDKAEIRGEMKHMLKGEKYASDPSERTDTEPPQIEDTLADEFTHAVKNSTSNV